MGNENENENNDSSINDSLYSDENIFEPKIEKLDFYFNCGNSPFISTISYSDNLIDLVHKTYYQTNINFKQDLKTENDIEENDKEKADKKNEEEKKPSNENIIISIPNMEIILENNNKIENMKYKGKKFV